MAKMDLQLLKKIVDNKAYEEVTWPDVIFTPEPEDREDHEGMIIDMQTANMLLTVYNALGKPESKLKFERMLTTYTDFMKLVDFGWKQVK